MMKKELVDRISEAAEISKAAAGKALDALIDSVLDAAQKGDRVTLVGFGTFSSAKRKARTGRNPQTGEELKIPAKKVLKFKASPTLKIK